MAFETESITGRDGYIVAQALATFIALQDKLPEYMREYSNASDAQAILERMPYAQIVEPMVATKFAHFTVAAKIVEPLES